MILVPRGFLPVLPNVGPAHTYATWNPSAKGAGIALSRGNTLASRLSADSNTYNVVRANQSITTPSYWEVLYFGSHDQVADSNGSNGICTTSMLLASNSVWLGSNTAGCANWDQDNVYYNNAVKANISTGTKNPAWYRFAYNNTTKKLWIGRADGPDWPAGGDPESGTNALVTMPSGTYYPAASLCKETTVANTMLLNSGQLPFQREVPVGFQAGIYT